MVTGSQFHSLLELSNDFIFSNEVPIPNPELSTDLEYGRAIESTSLSMYMVDDVFPPSLDFDTQVQSLNDNPNDHESDSAFKFLNQFLMEESMDEKNSMFQDPLALQATEKSFYEVIGKPYPPSPDIDIINGCPNSLNKSTCQTNENSADPSLSDDPGFHPLNLSTQLPFTSSQTLGRSVNSSTSNNITQIDSLMNMNPTSRLFSDKESKLQIWKRKEEASKFPPSSSELVINLDKNTLAPKPIKEPPKVKIMVTVEKDHTTSIRGRKHFYRPDSDVDERSSKQSAVYEDEVELSEMFDNLFLCDVKGVKLSSKGDVKFLNGYDKFCQQNRLSRIPKNKKVPSRKQGTESVALEGLLLNCAQAAAYNDLPEAHEHLKKIKQYASSTGDACQRVANVFANGLEARLAGTGGQMHAALASNRISASETLKAYEVYLSTCPFVINTRINTNKKILKAAAKGSTLHIVDFGISYGFQWPLLIPFLSIRPGGPPKLRITGIDFPQPGFRPADLIEEAGQRLAKQCKRFNVPFEYRAIERHSWETIDINDLKLVRDEVLVVNCFLQFQNLPEETGLADSPKDGILKLIRRMKPDLFSHSIVNGLYSAPFFLTRFREALFYYASLFDMLDVTLPPSNLERLHFEKEFEREVLNIIACEGKQRVVRPETYKQWQIRSMQAGFKMVPLEMECGQRRRMEAKYHKDFLYDEDCNWMLQGWKGRVLYASSCWVPV